MLVLSRFTNERIFIGDSIVLTVIQISGERGNERVRLGITAPSDVTILREEVALRAAIEAGREQG